MRIGLLQHVRPRPAQVGVTGVTAGEASGGARRGLGAMGAVMLRW